MRAPFLALAAPGILFSLLFALAAPQAPPLPLGRVIAGYLPAWSDFDPRIIDGSKLTFVIYAFAGVSPKGLCSPGDLQDDIQDGFARLASLKARYPGLKFLVSVGGWTGSRWFTRAARSPGTFADSCVSLFLEEGIFDGIDIDWEFPVEGGSFRGDPTDKRNFTLLVRELRRRLDELGARRGRYYFLSIAGGANPNFIFRNTELARIAQYVDFIIVMAYDFHGPWEKVTNFNAPLYPTASDPSPNPVDYTVDGTVRNYFAAGVPPEKILLGIPFYGHSWRGVQDENEGLYQPAAGPGPGTKEPGNLSFWDIAAHYERPFRKHFHPEALVPWLFNGDIFISYEDQESVALKARYIKAQGLLGAAVWELTADIPGAPEGSLLQALHSVLYVDP